MSQLVLDGGLGHLDVEGPSECDAWTWFRGAGTGPAVAGPIFLSLQ